jgi:hypothetical protein
MDGHGRQPKVQTPCYYPLYSLVLYLHPGALRSAIPSFRPILLISSHFHLTFRPCLSLHRYDQSYVVLISTRTTLYIRTMVRVELRRRRSRLLLLRGIQEIDNGSCLILKAARRRNSERRRPPSDVEQSSCTIRSIEQQHSTILVLMLSPLVLFIRDHNLESPFAYDD